MHLRRLEVRGLRAGAEDPLDVRFPGRFSVLVGANGSGKTTVCDAAYLAHRRVFPRLPRFSASALGEGNCGITAEYRFEVDPDKEGPYGTQLQTQAGVPAPGTTAVTWARTLTKDLGSIRATAVDKPPAEAGIRFVYLPAWRNPLDELARREAQVLVELLRAEQQRLDGTRNLQSLRQKATALLEALSEHELISGLEARIEAHLSALSAGVSRHWPYIRGQAADDVYLARVLEMMLAVLEGRGHARPLEVSGLGYVNLLHIAVTLAAIPDPSRIEEALSEVEAAKDLAEPAAAPLDGESPDADAAQEREAREELLRAEGVAEAEEDSFFPSDPFHATVLIEEPEAHLHPQLQHSLVRYLRRTVAERPELQVILSTHAPDIVSSCDPRDVVALRKLPGGGSVARTLGELPIQGSDDVFRKARLHLDATRSAALFAERMVLVEGVTDAAVLRAFGWAWAKDNAERQAFIDALSVVVTGSRIGKWPVRLLATKDHEVAERIAVLADSDLPREQEPSPPAWAAEHDPKGLRFFFSRPTLEPAVFDGNDAAFRTAFTEVGLAVPSQLDADGVGAVFKSARAATKDRPAEKAGAGASKKGEFALALAGALLERIDAGETVQVPGHFVQLFEYLSASLLAGPADGRESRIAASTVE